MLKLGGLSLASKTVRVYGSVDENCGEPLSVAMMLNVIRGALSKSKDAVVRISPVVAMGGKKGKKNLMNSFFF